MKPINRKQLIWRTVDVERLVEEDHPVRAIWEMVGRLDLGRFCEDIEAVEGVAGRSALDPALLISLWVYGYSEGVGSAREISRRCEYHPAYQWLTGVMVINHHTLSDFRVKHKEALDELFTEVLGVLSLEGLVSIGRVVHDGSKVKANAGVDTFRREEKIRAHLEVARQQVEQMGDPRSDETSRTQAKARERAVRERKERLELALGELERLRGSKRGQEEKEKLRVSETDPEARIMKQGDGGYAPSYNMQISTQASHGIVVGVGVSQAGSDYGLLTEAVEQVGQRMGEMPEQFITDGGFTSRENILEMSGRGVDFYGSLGDGSEQTAGQMKRREVDEAFGPEAFVYDEQNDRYLCPVGEVLRYAGKQKGKGVIKHTYRMSRAVCVSCPQRPKCCPHNGARGRSIVRTEESAEVLEFRAKMETEEAKQIYRQRGAVAEFTNCWIKEKLGLRQFRLRGLIKVGIEALWVCLTYNIQQWIRLRWRPLHTQSAC